MTWYTENKRDLPWRATRDPYAILVSETMLQQTGVERVIPKYHAFLSHFPTLESLAQASTGEVIRLWSGLGYNRRAVRLQQAAREALRRWGTLPSSVEDLLSLPGVGPYTARAVACFAFAAQVAVLDTNVRRVLTRVMFGVMAGDPVAAGQSEGHMLVLAEDMLPPGRAGDWNQALMDLGATICTQSSPRCLVCPIRSSCRAASATIGREALAEPKPRWKQAPFVASRRYYRGRIVEVLRHLAPGAALPVTGIGPLIKSDFGEADETWLHDLIQELAAEGLVRIEDGGHVSLPL